MKPLLLPVIALCMTAAASHAATIVYNFTGTNDTMVSTNGAASSTRPASSNSFGSGITASVFSASSTSGAIGFHNGLLKAQHKTDTDTLTFSITIPALVSVDLTGLTFDYGRIGGDYPGNPNWSISAGGVNRMITPSTGAITATSGTSSSAAANLVFSGAGFSNLTNTTVTFTLLDTAAGNNNTFSGGAPSLYQYYDNFTLTGTVIPEPSAALLGGIGMLCLLRRRR